MSIKKIIVDKLPESASQCKFVDFAHELSGKQEYLMNVYCKLDIAYSTMTPHEYVTQRCPNCPLAEEAEESAE